MITELYCQVDDFNIENAEQIKRQLISNGQKRQREGKLSLSEIMTILINFQQQRYRQFKAYYEFYVKVVLKKEFPTLPSYNHFIELVPMRQQIISLQQYGATAEQTAQVTATMYQSIAGGHADFNAMSRAVANVNANLQQQVNHFKNSRDTAISMTQALTGANVSSQDLAMAQLALNKATQASINGMIRMDNQTLSNLQNAIDNARAKVEQTKVAMLDLTKQAKGMVDNLTGELARLKGDDTVALKIEHNKKLADIEQKIADARKRNNADEVAHLQRALELQRQINAEQSRQATVQKQKEQAEKVKQSQSQSNTANDRLDTNDIKQSFSELMAKAKKDGKQELFKELSDDMKRLAR